jgi:hypothetical protein
MNDRNPPPWDEIRGVIERIDDICRESERTRDRADHSMRRRPIWPDPSPTEPVADDQGKPPDKGDDEK